MLFEEQLHDTAFGMAISIAALGAIVAGLVVLARAKGATAAPTPAPEPVPAPA